MNLLSADHARDHGAEVDADPDLPAGRIGPRRLGHGERAAHARQHRIGVRLQQIGGRDHAVADGLDLLEPVRAHQLLAGAGQAVEVGDHLLGRVPLAVRREAHDVAEQHRDLLVALGGHAIARLELGDRRGRQDRVQQAIGARPLALDLAASGARSARDRRPPGRASASSRGRRRCAPSAAPGRTAWAGSPRRRARCSAPRCRGRRAPRS